MENNEPRCLHVYTGEGKGKTTAAVGLAVRMLGQGGRVVFASFLKDGRSGELGPLFALGAEIQPMPIADGLYSRMPEAERARYRAELSAAVGQMKERLRAGASLVVLDEMATALTLGALPEAEARALLSSALASGEAVATGRYAPDWLLAMADYVTVMEPRRHPFADRGLAARRGIEW